MSTPSAWDFFSRLPRIQLTWDNAPHARHFPACAREIVGNCSFRRFPADRQPLLPVDHVYVVHYHRNVIRRAFQEAQLPKLGIPFSLVTGYDREALDGHHRACLLTKSSKDDLAGVDLHSIDPAFTSQVVKLLAAMYDAITSGHRAVLSLEDDAVVHFEHIPLLARNLARVGQGYTIVFSGSYNPSGVDGIAPGFYRKDALSIPPSRGRGRIMPAVGCVISAAGAAHLLSAAALPVRAPIDMYLSDERLPSFPRTAAYVSKPYAFYAGAYGAHGIFGGEGIGQLSRAEAYSHNNSKVHASLQSIAKSSRMQGTGSSQNDASLNTRTTQ